MRHSSDSRAHHPGSYLSTAIAGYILMKQLNFHISLVRLVGC
jgi:hypothetical protein